jgi:D-3-phosphoglycerate dehydrogenase
MRKGTFVVNTSRGGVLDLDALDEALRSGHLGGAAVDVYHPEPPTGHPILENPKAILTPHVAGITLEATARMTISAVEQIALALSGTLPPFAMDPSAWDGPASRRPSRSGTLQPVS